MTDVLMPRLSDSMEEGTIVHWLVEDGHMVTAGEEIAEIETDKATMPYEADVDGEIRIAAAEGTTLPVGAVIATIGTAESAKQPPPGETAPFFPTAKIPSATTAAAETPAPPRIEQTSALRRREPNASPVARRMAAELGVELQTVVGSGPGGRIVKVDIETAASEGPTLTSPATDGDRARSDASPASPVALSRTQALIARRMAESHTNTPAFSVTMTVDMSKAVALRSELKSHYGSQPAPSMNDLVIRACALALREHPRVNASFDEEYFLLHPQVNVGLAVATDDALIVPTIKEADKLTLDELAAATRSLAAKVRDGTISPPELTGATFTVSNLGMLGVTHFTAMINPPQAAILAVGAVERRVVAVDGAFAERERADLTLSCDHRILYGADAARFLVSVRARLEQPVSLLVSPADLPTR
jgi:pyruvate dehydrogenase E2 component (dihydrolipoamide acetyltransferase)